MSSSEQVRVEPEKRAAFHIPSLDGLRAVAFLLVFLGHVGIPGAPGGFGVTVFFFLSGYLITTLLRMEFERTGRISFKLFYLRRALRILPPFYLVLVIAILLTGVGAVQGTLRLGAIASQALHYFNYWGIFYGFDGVPVGTGVYWSLAIEEHFYALFPALYLACTRFKLSGKGQRALFIAICGGVFLWRCVLVFGFQAESARTYMGTDTRCDSLLLGCALAVAGSPTLDRRSAGGRPSVALLLALAGGTVLLLVSFVVRGEQFRETLRYSIQGVGLYPLFYAAIAFPAWGPFRLLNLPLLRFLGKLSFSLYLVHQIVIGLVYESLPHAGGLRAVLALPASVAVSWVIWHLVEKPTTRLRKQLEAR